MSRWRRQFMPLGGEAAALTLAMAVGLGACSSSELSGDPDVAVPSTPAASSIQLFNRARDTAKGFERIREVERLDRVSVIRVETNYWGGASGGFRYGLECLAELTLERGFSHFIVLDDCARRLGVAPNLGNDWQVVIGFLEGPDVDLLDVFAGYDLSERDRLVWPAIPGAPPSPLAILTDLWEVFTTTHYNWGGRAADGPDDKSGWPQLCEDA